MVFTHHVQDGWIERSIKEHNKGPNYWLDVDSPLSLVDPWSSPITYRMDGSNDQSKSIIKTLITG